MVEAPILHVNANDPEAAYFAALFAIDYRNTFKRDVVIDLVCYRRHGHNEADEPSATQPIMYKVIKSMQVPYLIYAQRLASEGVIADQAEKALVDAYRDALDSGKSVVELAKEPTYEFSVKWEPFLGTSWTAKADTSLPLKQIQRLAKQLEVLPEGFVVQPQVKKMLDVQKKMAEGEAPIQWGYAETLAYASLLEAGYPIRLCGQDSGRGTFAHRHAVLSDQNTGDIYIPLSHLSPGQAQINIVDSLLSEEAVLAFEYGYATTEPNFLVLWEAMHSPMAKVVSIFTNGQIKGDVMWLSDVVTTWLQVRPEFFSTLRALSTIVRTR